MRLSIGFPLGEHAIEELRHEREDRFGIANHLAASGNPLAIPVSLRIDGQPYAQALTSSAASPGGRVLVLVHALG